MEIKDMKMADVEARMAAINEELRKPEADLDALEQELDQLEERKKEIIKAAEERRTKLEEIAAAKGTPAVEEERNMPEKKYGIDSKEYRDAFMANLVGRATEEQRAILADNTNYGDGLALPTALDKEVWDQVAAAHPIMGDIDVLKSGMAVKVTKVTPAAITKKKDSDASTEQSMAGVDVVLVGADYHAYVGLSYAEAKMSQGAMEQFLVKEVASAVGDAAAKDVFAKILTDAGAGQKVTSTSDLFADIKSALGLATLANAPVIYAPASEYYNIVGAISTPGGYPFNIGATLGCPVKLDTAATKVTIVDPKLFLLNVIQDTLVESDRDVKSAQFVISGYMRAEGCLRKTKAAAYVD